MDLALVSFRLLGGLESEGSSKGHLQGIMEGCGGCVVDDATFGDGVMQIRAVVGGLQALNQVVMTLKNSGYPSNFAIALFTE
jgi:hypothetical protein